MPDRSCRSRVPYRARGLAAAVCLAVLPVAAAAQIPPVARDIADQLTGLLARVPGRAWVGLVVADVRDGQRWFEYQPQALLKPASVMKLFVTAAALERFGPLFHYRTPVYYHEGELWVIGAGDPGLGDFRLCRRHGRSDSDPFDRWADALRARGVSSIQKIVLDDSILDQEFRHPDWPADQANAWYQAPVAGLNLNDNCLDIRVEPTDGTLRLTLHPDLPPNFYANSLRLAKMHRPSARRELDSDVFELSGTIARATELGPVAAGRPTVFFGYALKQALTARGIAVTGDVVRRAIPPEAPVQAQLLDEHVTPLTDVLWRCNTFSQNLFAECLLKTLAAYAPDGSRSDQPGSWAAGRRVLRSTLAQMGVDTRGAELRDGSGLSHVNRVTAEQIASLLVLMHRHPHRAAFVESLAVPGQDGSLRRYDAALAGRLHGKTGTLASVRSLAGYATRADGTTLAFAILCNGESDPDLPLRVAQILADGPPAR